MMHSKISSTGVMTILSTIIIIQLGNNNINAFNAIPTNSNRIRSAGSISGNVFLQHTKTQPLYSTIARNNEKKFADIIPEEQSSPSQLMTNNNTISSSSSSNESMNVMSYMNEEPLEEDSTIVNTKIITRKDELKNNIIWDKISEKVGKVSEERVAFPELVNGDVPRLFSNIRYDKNTNSQAGSRYKTRTRAVHESGSIIGAASLVAGTTIGAGILGLPTATAPIGFLPSVGGLLFAWVYMVISGLLIAELSINRIGETGRLGLGLLDLYKNVLGNTGNVIGSSAYFFLHYAMMVAYIAQGGANFNNMLSGSLPDGSGQILFAGIMASSLYFLKPTTIEKINNALVATLGIAFGGILYIGSQSADVSSLVSLENQHPENVINAFPIFFLSLVYQNIVPTIVTQLEGDRQKITQAIVLGTFVPLAMFIAWNGVILGNIYNAPSEVMEQITSGALDPISLLQSNGLPGSEILSTFVTIFSQLAVTTSLIGFVYGLNEAITDTFKLPKSATATSTIIKPKNNSNNNINNNIDYKPLIYSGIFLPPLLLSLYNPDIFYNALELGGAFGVSTLFLVLPPIMIWKKRYGEDMDEEVITTLPMVPGGKITLGSVWKAASTLIVEQIADKLGILDYIGHIVDRG